ncbi:hypothetical protein Tco_0098822 [Tanacetum coccineum]
MGNVKKLIAERIRHQIQYDRRVDKRQLETQETKVDMGKALDVGLVITESSGTESEVQDESSRSGNDIDVDDAGIDNDMYSTVDACPNAIEKTNRGTGYERQFGLYDNQRAVNVVRARENIARECQKPKRAKDSAYHKEKMLLCKPEEDGIQLSIQEVTLDASDKSGPIFDAEPLQKDTNITLDSSDMCINREEADQDDKLAKERDLLSSLIAKLEYEIDKKCQSVQTMNMLNRNCKMSFVKIDFLMKAKSVNPRLYDIGCYNDNLALMLAPESDKTIRLAQESQSKLSPSIDDLEKYLDEFYRFLKEEMVADLKYFNSLEKEVESLQSQLDTQRTQFSNEIDRLSREYYYADHMNAILGVYTKLDEFIDLQCGYLDQEQIKHDKVWKQKESSSFQELNVKYFEVQDLKAQL